MEILRTPKPNNEIDYIDDIQILSEPKAPLMIENLDYLTITVDQKLRSKMKSKELKVVERDSIQILSKPKQPLQTEYIDEIIIEGKVKPENKIQMSDQIEILKTPKPDNKIDYIDDIQILAEQKEPLVIENQDFVSIVVDQKLRSKAKSKTYTIEERDAIEIFSKPKDPLQTEYIDELYIQGNVKPENKVQVIDQMEILRTPKPENEVNYIDEIEILNEEKPANEIEKIDDFNLKADTTYQKMTKLRQLGIEERDSLEILSQPKEPLQTEYIDELYIQGEIRPENEIQVIDQMDILKSPKPENEVNYIDDIQLLSQPKKPLMIDYQDYVEIQIDQRLKRQRPEDFKITVRDSLEILSAPREPLQTEYIDEINIQGNIRPDNEIQLIDQMEILPTEKRNLIVQNIDVLTIVRDYDELFMKPIWDMLDVQVSGGLTITSIPRGNVGLELQDIDNFEIIGEYNQPLLEQEYINSIEIVERNALAHQFVNNEIEYMDDLQISPNRNEIRLLAVNMPVNQYEIEELDDIEIIGKNKEEFEIEQIDNISYQDKVIQNKYNRTEIEERTEINRREEIIDRRTGRDGNVNEYGNQYDSRLNRGRQINQRYNQDEEGNERGRGREGGYGEGYEEETYEMNINKQIRNRPGYESNEFRKYELIQEQERENWNRYNTRQHINSIYVPRSSNVKESNENLMISESEYRERYIRRSNWNEINRQQGIVNLSVIDDKNQDLNLSMDNDNPNNGHDQNNNNNTGNNNSNDNDNDNDYNHGNNNNYNNSGMRNVSNYDSDERIPFDRSRGTNDFNNNISGRGSEVNRRGQQVSSHTSSINFKSQGRGDNKISQSGNYMVKSQTKKDDKSNKPGFQTYSMNYNITGPKREEDPKFKKQIYQSQVQPSRGATGMMRKKEKNKKFEYLRDNNQRNNFQ